ncbi:rod shape-determining protein MreC [Ruminiclostridium cellulolyticum]|uniref:Cell shape-determining protein MreC n=1 Tax=Ruminiclostridium cellulolyticum (strain ATCC 35319 / DSM 5812 / JCM 6584 / H10) TaxID=394503 RepID=B8I6P8_RUMCH|nr:rod shape-determining protein MreC [Ruminiclostridium cellulolyticum]ACL76890.1 rod shape-determining protein MreC [Ruminiclostridium cellulolyticum H10]
MKYFKSRALVITIIVLILIVCVGLTVNPASNINWIGNLISVPFTSVEKAFSYTGQKVEEGISLFDNVQKLQAENKELKEKIDKLNNERTEYLRLKRENEDLRKVFDLKDQFASYDHVGANIIARDGGNLFNVFLTDKGSANGINYNMPVITSKGLVGRVVSAQLFSSKIISIIEDGSSVSALVAKSGDYVVVKGDIKLEKEGLCKLEYIPADLDLIQGDIIQTSGIGGIYPRGITIGTVKEIRAGESDLDRYAIIQPAADLKRLNQVVILRNKDAQLNSEMENADK